MIDLRSDTVTKPSPEMLEAMMSAEVGDDVYGEDKTVNRLQQQLAQLTGKESGLFVTSGTQSNLLALLSHCDRGDEYIAGQEAHTYRFEGGGAAVLGSIQPQPLPFNQQGELDLESVKAAIKPADFHFARSRLVCLENTQAGKVLSMAYLDRFSELADSFKLKSHLDGARLFNAVISLGVSAESICRHFDTVSICLSKGLGCPVGSVLVGDDKTISKARRWRKVLGGGMRQAGILAAAGIYALEHNVNRLADDHIHAQRLAEGLVEKVGFKLKGAAQTNMIKLEMSGRRFSELRNFLISRDIKISSPRWVLHRDIEEADLELILDACMEFSKHQEEIHTDR